MSTNKRVREDDKNDLDAISKKNKQTISSSKDHKSSETMNGWRETMEAKRAAEESKQVAAKAATKHQRYVDISTHLAPGDLIVVRITGEGTGYLPSRVGRNSDNKFHGECREAINGKRVNMVPAVLLSYDEEFITCMYLVEMMDDRTLKTKTEAYIHT